MRFYKIWFASTIIGLVALTVTAFAGVPPTINIQGKLTDDTGTPVADGPHSLVFVIYGSESGDDAFWSSGDITVTVTDGLFNYRLGSANPLPADLFMPGADLFLGITLSPGPEMEPRTKFTSTAFAFQAVYADTADVAFQVSCKGCISFSNIGDNGAREGQIMKMIDGDWAAADDETGGGDITGIIAGDGLAGGGFSGDVTIDVDSAGITNSMIADEPGVAHTYLHSFDIETMVATADSIVITVPSSGYVVVTVTGYVNFGYDTSNDWIKVSLSKTRGSIDDHNLAYIKEFNAAEVAQIHENFSITVVDVVSSAGEYKYYLITDELNDSIFTESYLNRVHITAVFYPTAYGAVDDQI